MNPRNNFKLNDTQSNYYVTIKNIKQANVILDEKCDKVSDEALEIINRRSDLKVGDILFTSIQPVGLTYLIKEKPQNWNINESVFTIRPNYSKINSEYLFMLLSHEHIKVYTKNSSAGSIHKGIRHSVLKDYKTLLPSINLANKFKDAISPNLDKINSLQMENNQLKELRDWLLPMLMNGQVTVK